MIKAGRWTEELLKDQRDRRRRELEWRLNWIIQHEDTMDPEVRLAAIDFLKNSIAELDKPVKMEKALRPGRASLRDRLRLLVVTILTQTTSAGK